MHEKNSNKKIVKYEYLYVVYVIDNAAYLGSGIIFQLNCLPNIH